jgi:DNA-binding LacI/PurR family transcriptional regulator
VVVAQPFKKGVPFVGIDDEAAAREAAEYLLRLGHKRFAVVSFALSPNGREGLAGFGRQEAATFQVSRLRLRGYRDALENAGLHWSEVPVYECPGSARAFGYQAAGVLLSSKQRPTVIVASSDQLALGVIERARQQGISVPEDVSVVGFDDISAAASANPPLTTIRQDHTEKGLLAGRTLVSRLRGKDLPSAGPLATRLVIRGSTSPPP